MIRRIRPALAGTDPALVLSQIAARVRGYDLDPFGVWLAQTAAHFAVHDLELRPDGALPGSCMMRDSLDVRSRGPRRLRSCFQQRAIRPAHPAAGRVAPFYARSTYGHANLYGLFTDAGLHYAEHRGVVAYVMPTSMLSGLYFQSLRALLAKEAPPHEFTFVTERSGMFDDALQETMLATYRKGRRTRTGAVRFLTIVDRGRAAATDLSPMPEAFRCRLIRNAPWLLPRTPDQAALAASTARHEIPPGELRLRRFDWPARLEPAQAAISRHSAEAGHLPVIWAEAVTSDGRFIWRADRRKHVPWFAAETAQGRLAYRRSRLRATPADDCKRAGPPADRRRVARELCR